MQHLSPQPNTVSPTDLCYSCLWPLCLPSLCLGEYLSISHGWLLPPFFRFWVKHLISDLLILISSHCSPPPSNFCLEGFIIHTLLRHFFFIILSTILQNNLKEKFLPLLVYCLSLYLLLLCAPPRKSDQEQEAYLIQHSNPNAYKISWYIVGTQ